MVSRDLILSGLIGGLIVALPALLFETLLT